MTDNLDPFPGVEVMANPEDPSQIDPKEQVAAARRGRKPKDEKPAAEFVAVTTTIKLRLLRDVCLKEVFYKPGTIVEVDEATAADLLHRFELPPQYSGERATAPRETFARAEKVN